MSLLPLRGNCNNGVHVTLLCLLTEFQTAASQTCIPFEIRQLLDWLSSAPFHYCLHHLSGPERPGPKHRRCLSITVPPSHPLSSSERCVLLLISFTRQKLGEQMLGQTAALLVLDT